MSLPGRRSLFVLVPLLLFLLALLHRSRSSPPLPRETAAAAPTALVLFWTAFFGTPFDGQDRLWACPELKSRCRLTSDKDRLADASAVLFHAIRDVELKHLPDPRLRKPSQRFVFFVHESAETTKWDRDGGGSFAGDNLGPGYFNWTMTTRRDSDVPAPYWLIAKDPAAAQPRRSPEELVEGKDIDIFWAVSNCHTTSKREEAVAALARETPVSQLGACSQGSVSKEASATTLPPCPKASVNVGGEDCMAALLRRSYFHLALENSVCMDYVTEKYWARLEAPSVPIVLSRKVLEPFAPPKSFVAFDDFRGPKEMAAFLKRLLGNATAYAEYFEWRWEGWRKESRLGGRRTSFCGLCERLLQQPPLPPKAHRSVEQWWFGGSGCRGDGLVREFLSGRA